MPPESDILTTLMAAAPTANYRTYMVETNTELLSGKPLAKGEIRVSFAHFNCEDQKWMGKDWSNDIIKGDRMQKIFDFNKANNFCFFPEHYEILSTETGEVECRTEEYRK